MSATVKKILIAVALLLVAVLSFTLIAGAASSPANHDYEIQALDSKKDTVLKLTAATTATSAAITMLPGDVATPIATEIADLSGFFLLALCAIYLEKYLVTITGYLAFKVLIPAACVIFAVYVFSAKPSLRRFASKLTVFALAAFLVIPASVRVTNLIEDSYESSIAATIEDADNVTAALTGEETVSTSEEELLEDDADDSWWGKLSSWLQNTKETVSSTLSGELTQKVTEKLKTLLNGFIEAAAVMLVTSCLIPILVLMCFWWLMKAILEVNIDLPRMPHPFRRGKEPPFESAEEE